MQQIDLTCVLHTYIVAHRAENLTQKMIKFSRKSVIIDFSLEFGWDEIEKKG